MIEINAFLAMLGVLILTISLMHMVVLTRFVRRKTASVPDEYFAQLNSTLDRTESMRQFILRYRLAHAAVALIGILLLCWLAGYMQQPDWDKRWVVFPVMGYFVLQWLPMIFTAVTGIKHMKALRNYLMHAKRKASLKRRGLFDFVSPLPVFLAVGAYLLFFALTIRIAQDPKERLLFIGAVTFDYALTIFTIYRLLYGKRSDPFETHAGRLYTIGVRTRSSIYSCIAVVFFTSFVVAVVHNELQRWMPFALAAFLTVVTIITFSVFNAPPRWLGADEIDTRETAS